MRQLKINSLPSSKTWVDKDDIMLHSCFQILKDFIEIENGATNCDYNSHKDFVDEVRFLYKWWEKRSKLGCLDSNHNKKDDEMLLRLIKIRSSLWT